MLKQGGFTLVEVLIFVTIITLFFISAVAIVNLSLLNMKNSEYRILATHGAQQLKEWLDSERNEDWNEFTNNINFGSQDKVTRCFPSFEWNGNCDAKLDSIFIRTVDFSKRETKGDEITVINALIKVSWSLGNNNYKITIPTTFSLWE